MKALILGARGAVGSVVQRELGRDGHIVTAASRTADGDASVDLRGDLAPLARLADLHDVIVNASGIERSDVCSVIRQTPFIDISATGPYLDALRAAAVGPIVLGAGLVPGLSTILAAALGADPGSEIDVLVMLGAGEQHGPAAVAWTAGLIGTEVFRPPEGGTVLNLRTSVREAGPDGRTRRYLRADFPDHVLIGAAGGLVIRSYLTLSSSPMTMALGLIGRMPVLRGALTLAPRIGTDAWHIVARNRQTGAWQQASGFGQSEATGRLAALAATRISGRRRAVAADVVTMADLVTLNDALEALNHAKP
ncbi:hypothetical protein O7622_05620 [Micromonospora sp. WMMD1076]|uniref:hypothetical protein n=1 Tax=Micromonospora sp. WMMD1076 TaxID=3016103 RepID=UPI00249C8703|nr:hypothetical protein [Micromonospora sp. WMMD1076]WFF08051.1 hypothetical protein O7622_05620 [Micromonospora sp. WMMD1076]